MAVGRPGRFTNVEDAESWQAIAACQDIETNVFFPSDSRGVEAARRICQNCVVKEECLDYALQTRQDHGVWGGASERERRRIGGQRARAARGVGKLTS